VPRSDSVAGAEIDHEIVRTDTRHVEHECESRLPPYLGGSGAGTKDAGRGQLPSYGGQFGTARPGGG
jgi:hypothetical protein